MTKKALGLAMGGVIAAAGLFTFGGSHIAFAGYSCNPNDGPVSAGGVSVYSNLAGGSSQYSGSGVNPTAVVGACVNEPAGTGTFTGGSVETGVSPSNGVIYNPVGGAGTAAPGTYAVVNGNDANTSNLQGYFGVSDYESGSGNNGGPADSPCGGGGSTNSNGGGSIGVDPLCDGAQSVVTESGSGQLSVAGTATPVYLVAPVACGHFSGTNWGATPRDGCWEP